QGPEGLQTRRLSDPDAGKFHGPGPKSDRLVGDGSQPAGQRPSTQGSTGARTSIPKRGQSSVGRLPRQTQPDRCAPAIRIYAQLRQSVAGATAGFPSLPS